jgi:preprotein translocase subunit SecA
METAEVPETEPEIEQEAPKTRPEIIEIPRNAPCPCKSGLKYKRCCARNAPPVLNKAA